MSRLIDADDFGNRMYHEVFEKDSEDQRWDSGCWMRYKLFERVLREQPTVSQWIPCSEKLPEKFGYCIVSDGCSVWFASFESGEFRGILSGHALDPVVAWMPLPDPYKGGEQDEND